MRDLLGLTALLAICTACPTYTEALEKIGGTTGHDGGPNDDPDGGPRPRRDGSLLHTITLAEYCARSYELAIDKAALCYNLDAPYTDRMLAELDFISECESSTTEHLYAFDPVNAASCIEVREVQTCAEFYFPWQFDPVPSCTRALVGAGEPGERCTKLDECGAGLICDVQPPLGACTHRCVIDHGSKREGESCSTLHDCRAGLECPSTVIPNRACYPEPGAGDPCVPGEESTCGKDFSCSLVSNTCERVRGEGERCQFSNDCAPMLICTGLQGEERCQLGGRAGDDCLEGQGSCYAEAYCSEQDRCAPRGLTNAPCSPNGAVRCAEGWFCDPRSSTCQLPRPYGEPCSAHSHCDSHFCSEGRCGDPCE